MYSVHVLFAIVSRCVCIVCMFYLRSFLGAIYSVHVLFVIVSRCVCIVCMFYLRSFLGVYV